MKSHRIVLISILSLMFATCQDFGFAMDEDGCLTCHQYPGLVRAEKQGTFRVLHIDEAIYRQSKHGQTKCVKCHTTIAKVPHTGENKVNCFNGCHVAQKDKNLIANYDLKTLHDKEQSYLTRLADGSSCRECHNLYPHQSSKLARAFINMHIGFMTCETCHIDREKFKSLQYDWASSETADFAGKPFGTWFNPKINDPSQSSHFISRVTVFSRENGEKKSLTHTWDTPKAKEYLAKEKELTPDEQKIELSYFHQDIHKNKISVTCNECHVKDSILDFKQLGFSEKKANDLVNLNIKGLVTKYKVFYFPQLFNK